MNKDFSYYLSKFLRDYLVIERNLSQHTIRSYKTTFELLINYLVKEKNMKLTDINFKNITREYILDFLKYLEEDKHNSISTRNQRLKAIRTFYSYCSLEEVENFNNITKILQIRFKKTQDKVIDYLTEEELKQVLESIDTSTKIGRRNLALLSLLYDTAARSSEIINLKIEDIHLEEKYAILNGKGNKQRIVPLMDNTIDLLKNYIKEDMVTTYIFSKANKPMNDRFIREVINKYCNNINNKNITPHVFRHTRAIHLLSAGVPLIYIRDLLGHSSIQTTERYARVLEKNKFKAIKDASPKNTNIELKDWNDDQNLLSQLLNL